MYSGLPALAAYIDSLPFGIDSHAACMVKASVHRDALASRGLDNVVDELPEALRALVLEPPPVTAWVPEVHAISIMTALRNRHFEAGPAGLDAYEEWTYERNRRLLTKPLYRALFLVLSPERLLKGLGRRWAAFRRGTQLEVLESGGGRALLRLRYPTNLYDETALRGLAGAYRAAAEAAGAHESRIEMIERTARGARWEARWR